jgi:SAM-dependent methyltransferase
MSKEATRMLARKNNRDIRTKPNHPPLESAARTAGWLQEMYQQAFRDLMISRIGEFLQAARKGQPAVTAVDLGCGPGDWTRGYLAICERAIGVDVRSDLIERARRGAQSLPRPERVEYRCARAADFDQFQTADLVGLGDCLGCLDDPEIDRLFANLDRALPTGACVYIRETVAQPQAHRPGGFARRRSDYERMFSVTRLRVVDCFPSSALIASQLIYELLGVRTFRTGRMLCAPVWFGHNLLCKATSHGEHLNWFLVCN